jgi:hypothetical protein
MAYRPGDVFWEQGFTHSSAGALTNADSLPTAALTRNGTDDGTVTCTVTNVSTGRYKVTGTIPSGYAANDKCQVIMFATVGGVSDAKVIVDFSVDLGGPTNFNLLSVDSSGRVDIGKILGTASAGQAGYAGIDWAAIANPSHANTFSTTNFNALASTVNLGGTDEATLGSLHAMISSNVFTSAALANVSSLVLATPAHLLATDISGNVAVNNLPSTYPLSVNDEATLASLHTMIASNAFTSGAMANIPILTTAQITTAILSMTINGHTFADLMTMIGFDAAGNPLSVTYSSMSPWTITCIFTDGSATATFVSTFTDNTFTKMTGRTVSFTGLP